MESFRKYINLNEMAMVQVRQPDGTVVTVPTQHHAEASLITHGPKPTKSGSTLPDLEVHFGDGSKVNAEVKSGRNIDIAQMAVNIDPESNDVSFSGPTAKKAKAGLKAHGVAQRIMKHLGRRVGDNHHKEASALSSQHHDFLTDKHKEYTESHFEAARRAHAAGNIGQEFNEKDALKSAKAASIEQIKRDHPEESKYVHTSSKEVKPLTAMGSSLAHMLNSPEGGGEIRKKMTNRTAYDYIKNYEDPVQKHIHQGTGEIAVFPVSNDHREHTDRMGLKGQVSLQDIVKKDKRSSLGVYARLRRKETRGSLSVAGDSSRFVDAVKRHGGTVFANADEYKAHAEKHGFQVRSGQFPNEPNEDAPVSEQTIVEGLATSLGSSIMSNILDPEKAKAREESRKQAEKDKVSGGADSGGTTDGTTDGPSDGTTDTADEFVKGTEDWANPVKRGPLDDIRDRMPTDPRTPQFGVDQDRRRYTANPNKPGSGEMIDNKTGKPVGPWPGAKDGNPPPLYGGPQESNPYKDWYQDEDGHWVNTPRATPATAPAGGDSTGPPPAGGGAGSVGGGGGTQEPPPVGPTERSPHDSSQSGQAKKGLVSSFDMNMLGSDYLQESIEKKFSDFLKEKHLELNAVGTIGGEILKNPKKKKVEESAMLMMIPMIHKMQNESRNTINNITQSQGNPDGR